MRYGFTDRDWNAAKNEMRAILIARATVRGMIPYGELVQQLRTIRLQPDSLALAAMLGEISIAEADAGRGMLTGFAPILWTVDLRRQRTIAQVGLGLVRGLVAVM